MVELALTRPTSARVGVAGDTFNTAVYLQRLGASTLYGTAVGAGDPFSLAILQRMDDEGISAELIVQAPWRLPGLYAIQRDRAGERRFYYWRKEAPARDYFQLVDFAKLQAAMLGADLIYLSAITLAVIGASGRGLLAPLLQEAVKSGVAVAFDTNYRAQLWDGHAEARWAIEAVVGISRYVSASVDDIAGFEPGGNARALASAWADKGTEVVLRHQDRSLEVRSDVGVMLFAAQPSIPVVDTTGAGDAFNAAYRSARLSNLGVREAVAAARSLSAMVVQHAGAITPRSAVR